MEPESKKHDSMANDGPTSDKAKKEKKSLVKENEDRVMRTAMTRMRPTRPAKANEEIDEHSASSDSIFGINSPANDQEMVQEIHGTRRG